MAACATEVIKLPTYVNGLCIGYLHKYCDAKVLVSTNMEHTTQQIVTCECGCHQGSTPVALESKPKTTSNEKARAFAISKGLKGKLLEDFMKGLEKR